MSVTSFTSAEQRFTTNTYPSYLGVMIKHQLGFRIEANSNPSTVVLSVIKVLSLLCLPNIVVPGQNMQKGAALEPPY